MTAERFFQVGECAVAFAVARLERRALQDALRSAIADRCGYCRRDADHTGWVVTLSQPEEQVFSGPTLKERMAW